jgi:prolyl-tRNA editing enzyme YbaK/EbsC (Cys-tRNA(Pro) deacylase)
MAQADFPEDAPVANHVLAAARRLGVDAQPVEHEPVRNLAEAAAARGVRPADVIKTMVVRRGDDDYLLVLVPGDRVISWPKMRALLSVNRLSMPDAEQAKAVTGFARGTITPFGTATPLPVIADQRMSGRRVTLGAGEHNKAIAVDADAVLTALDAVVADVTDPE